MTGGQRNSTALIIACDDCGCFYDAERPGPGGPDGRQEGTRVPFLLVSPYVLPANTDATASTSTGSIRAFIEAAFNLPPLSANVAIADNLMGDFDFAQPPIPLVHMVWRAWPAGAYQASYQTVYDPTRAGSGRHGRRRK